MNEVRFYAHGGTTPAREEVEAARLDLLAEQGERCGICDRKLDRGVVDHCHRHGIIRGLLCPSCNTGLGMFRDSVDDLLAAVAYLRRSERLIAEIEALDVEGPDGALRERLRVWRLENQRREQRGRADSFTKSDRTDT